MHDYTNLDIFIFNPLKYKFVFNHSCLSLFDFVMLVKHKEIEVTLPETKTSIMYTKISIYVAIKTNHRKYISTF